MIRGHLSYTRVSTTLTDTTRNGARPRGTYVVAAAARLTRSWCGRILTVIVPLSHCAQTFGPPMFAQQARYQVRYRRAGLLRQLRPLQLEELSAKQIELNGFRLVCPANAALASHRHLSDSGGRDLSLRQKPARARAALAASFSSVNVPSAAP